jgi:hypothetical protein
MIPHYSHSQQPYSFQSIWLNDHGNNIHVSSRSLTFPCQILSVSCFRPFVLFPYRWTFSAVVAWKRDIEISTKCRVLS